VTRWRRWSLRAALGSLVALTFVVVVLSVLWQLFPFRFEQLDDYPAAQVVADRHGDWLRVYRSAHDEIRIPVALDEMSHWIADATIAVEDRHFYSHPGVDPLAVIRAALQNVSRGKIHSGASTLTMQLVRMLEGRPRTYRSKAIEAFFAIQIDARLTKKRILEDYLNLAPYGGNVRGVEAAAWRYFGKNSRDLSLGEAALLAGLPQSPSRLRPDRSYERALARRKVVLESMLREGFIDEEQFAHAVRSRPRVELHPWPLGAPHFADLARASSASSCSASEHSRVRSTLDPSIQDVVEEAIVERLASLRRTASELSAAVVVMEVETGFVRALLGSPDFFDRLRHGSVNAAVARRSPGSALKPLLFAQAFDRGIVGPSTYLADVPTPFVAYVPRNYDRQFHGPVAASEALRKSYNIPAVRLQQAVGTPSFIRKLCSLGLDTVDRGASHYGLTLCLGGGEVRLLDLTNAYAALVRNGVWREARFVSSGDEPSVAGQPVFRESSAYFVLEALSTDDHLRAATHAKRSVGAPVIGYKTGTSFGLRDAWCVAFSSRFVVGVWFGDSRGRSRSELVGIDAAAPAAIGIVEEISAGAAIEWSEPDGLVEIASCSLTGFPASEHCPSRKAERVGAVSAFLPKCRVHEIVRVDPKSSARVCDACVGERRTEIRVVESWPPEVESWFARNGRPSRSFPHDPECSHATESERPGPRIVTPADGARYRLVRDAPFEQTILLSAAVVSDSKELFWFLGDELIAHVPAGNKVSWELRFGHHRLRCVDDRGRGSTATFVVE